MNIHAGMVPVVGMMPVMPAMPETWSGRARRWWWRLLKTAATRCWFGRYSCRASLRNLHACHCDQYRDKKFDKFHVSKLNKMTY
jgi:hypothetical protein